MNAQEHARCLQLVREIERHGGPPPHRAALFARIKQALRGELGFPFVAAGIVIAGGMVFATLGKILWETQETMTKGAREVLEHTTAAAKVMIWGGVAWLAWEAFFARDRRRRAAVAQRLDPYDDY